jgi:hypothetical protein
VPRRAGLIEKINDVRSKLQIQHKRQREKTVKEKQPDKTYLTDTLYKSEKRDSGKRKQRRGTALRTPGYARKDKGGTLIVIPRERWPEGNLKEGI